MRKLAVALIIAVMVALLAGCAGGEETRPVVPEANATLTGAIEISEGASGGTISLKVSGDGTSLISISVTLSNLQCDGFSAGSMTKTAAASISITEGSFHGSVTDIGEIDGEFTSSTEANGTINLMLEIPYFGTCDLGTWNWSVQKGGAAPDHTPPTISNISAANITETSTTITWTTNEPSTSQVEYGETVSYGATTSLQAELVTSHSVILGNLNPDTTYHFRVKSEDAAGNEVVSEDFNFTTLLSYSLSETDSLGVPYANPVGIAMGQENFWLMFGAHNSNEHRLVYYNINTCEVIKCFDYYNLIECLGTGVYGITWDGTAVWISVSGNTNKLVKVDPDTGEILKTWSSPTNLGPSDLAWDGNNLWLSSGTGQIYKVNPANGGSSIFLDLEYPSRDWGIAIREDELWVGNLFNNDITIYDASTGIKIGIIQDSLVTNGSLCFYGDRLAVLSDGGIKLYTIESP